MNEEQTKPLPDEDSASAEEATRAEHVAAADDVRAADKVIPAEDATGAGTEGPSDEGSDPGLGGDGEAAAGDDTGTSTALEPAPLDLTQVKRVLEAALLSTTDPLTVQQLKRLFGGEVDADTVRKVLDELRGEWSERSIELTSVASGWRFRVKPEYQKFLDRISAEKPPRYSRAVLETLAIIAYRQPVTRGDIEEVRGVAVSPPTLKALEERGWIETIGHRETPGRPALFATTKKFLDDLNLRSLEELPPLDELQAALEPAPTLVPIEAAPPPPEQDTLIDEAPTPEPSESQDESQQTPAG